MAVVGPRTAAGCSARTTKADGVENKVEFRGSLAATLATGRARPVFEISLVQARLLRGSTGSTLQSIEKSSLLPMKDCFL